jgi:hypothetical protein
MKRCKITEDTQSKPIRPASQISEDLGQLAELQVGFLLALFRD